MIYKGADLHAVGELRHSADVVAVVMRDQNVIELLETGSLGSGHDSLGVPAIEARPSGIDQQRLPGRTNYKRRLSSLNVDRVNLERLTGSICGLYKRCEKQRRKQDPIH
jgi:hypothetical protein